MTEKLYYWAENLETYRSDNVADYDQIIEIKRLNFINILTLPFSYTDIPTFS